MEGERRNCSRACLLLCLGLLWLSPGCCASLLQQRQNSAAGSGTWQQTWPRDSSSRGSWIQENAAALAPAASKSLESSTHAQPAESASYAEVPQAYKSWDDHAKHISGLFQASFRVGAREATPPAPALRAISRRAVHRRSLAQSPLDGMRAATDKALAPAPSLDQTAYLLVVMEVPSPPPEPALVARGYCMYLN